MSLPTHPLLALANSQKSTRQIAKQDAASTSGIRSSNRKRTQTKVFDKSTRERNNRKSEPESSKAAKRIKPGNDDEVQQEDEDDDNVVENGKRQIVTLELNCTEPNCKTISKNFIIWKIHLWTCHGQIAYKQLEDNARENQDGQTEYPCTECENVFNSFVALYNHWRKFHLIGKFQCSMCAFVATQRHEVYYHQRKAHSRFPCTHEECNKAFDSHHDLEQHQRVHSGETPFKCIWDNCEVTFTQLVSAVSHVRRKHFHLPKTVKEQKELNIIDGRDPKVYVQVA